MTNSIRKSLLRGFGFAAASGALLGAPVMAGPQAPATVAQGYGTNTTPLRWLRSSQSTAGT